MKIRIFNLFLVTLVITVSAFAQQSLRPGAAAPDFNGESLDGKIFNLSALQGKVVVLTFWSTRCEICHTEIPKLNQVVKRYKNKDVVFLALTMENQLKVEPYLRKNPFDFSILPNSFGVFLKYADMDKGGNINMGFPSYFLIDQRGSITLKSDGWDKASKLDSQIQRMLMSE